MSETTVEAVVQIPWGTHRDALPLSTVAFPQHSEASGTESAAIPMFRAYDGGGVAVLNYFGDRYLPAGTIKWFYKQNGAVDIAVRTSEYPFPDTDNILTVDFYVMDDGSLLLLETVASSSGGAGSRMALISAQGAVVVKRAPLSGGPYNRVVPDDKGRLFLLTSGEDNRLSHLDLDTGTAAERYAAQPGTELALAANKGTRLAANRLDNPGDARIAAPPDVPEALIYLFGVDDKNNYYTLIKSEIMVISFHGDIIRKLPLDNTPAPKNSPDGQVTILPRYSPIVAWQVDQAGQIYLSKVDAEGFSVLRVIEHSSR